MTDASGSIERGPHSRSGDVLDDALAGYLRAIENGEQPNRDELLARLPEQAQELREFFANHDRMARLARPMCEPTFAEAPTITHESFHYFGDYEILEEIARGGMGVVFKARQVTLNRIVAIKMILGGRLASRESIERFHTEAEAAAQLDHPGIVPIYEVGQHEGQHYFSMGFVEGTNLLARVAQGPFPVREAVQMVRTIAGAVQYAHDHGVIHRDLKPGNILLDRQGRPRVTDFGLAKMTESVSDLTGTGQVLGTPGYMPPEQAAAQVSAVGRLSDIYSLGALLYCVLTGRPPFQAATPIETLLQVQKQEPVAPRQLNPAIPLDLDTIVLKCLEKSPARRYATANEVAVELERFLAGQPIVARPIGRAARLWRWCRRNPIVAGLSALLLVALLGVTATSSLAYFRELAHSHEIADKNVEISQMLVRERESRREEKQARVDATDRLYRSLVDQARANRMSRRIGQRFNSFDVLTEAIRIARQTSLPPDAFRELRNEVIACLPLADVRTANIWKGVTVASYSADIDGNLERYAIVGRERNVTVGNVADGTELWHLAGMGPDEAWPTLSPDGRFLALWNTRFKLWNLTGPEPVLVCEESGGGPAFSPDCRELAVVQPQGFVARFDLSSGRQMQQFQVGPENLGLAYHPHARKLAISSKTNVRIVDLETESVLAELPQPGPRHLAWHPDGETLAVAGLDRSIHLWDVVSCKPVVHLKGHQSHGISFGFNHSGDQLASTSWDGTLRLWDPRTGEQRFQTPMGMHSLRFSRDDQRLGMGTHSNTQLSILKVAPVNNYYRTLIRDPFLGRGLCFRPAVSRDGRILAVAMADGLGFWDLASGKPLTFLPTGFMASVVFEPEGALVASGPTGVVRYSVDVDASAGTVQIGPCEQILPVAPPALQIDLSRDGRTLGQATPSGGLVWHRDLPDPPIPLGPHEDVRSIAVSPDGRWVATGSHSGTKVKIWEAQTGNPVCDLPIEGTSSVMFSPDSRWLSTSWEGHRLWEVGTWREVRRIGGRGEGAFSPDGKIFAVESGEGSIRLVNLDTGQDFAQLEDPQQDRAGALQFTADGTQLVAANQVSNSIHVWDLRAIRVKLVEMDLDWDLLPYRPVDTTATLKPLTLVPAAALTATP